MSFSVGDKVRGTITLFKPGESFKSVISYTGTIIYKDNEYVYIVQDPEGEKHLVELNEEDTMELEQRPPRQ